MLTFQRIQRHGDYSKCRRHFAHIPEGLPCGTHRSIACEDGCMASVVLGATQNVSCCHCRWWWKSYIVSAFFRIMLTQSSWPLQEHRASTIFLYLTLFWASFITQSSWPLQEHRASTIFLHLTLFWASFWARALASCQVTPTLSRSCSVQRV